MKDKIKFIEYNGIEGYIELMKHDVEPLNNPECKRIELYYDGKDIKAVLDYITNLQEENKEWSMIFDTFSKRPYAHKYLEQKKKELNNPNIIGLDSETIYKDYYELKSRIDKAIEYVEKSMNNAQPFYEYLCGDENGEVENLDKLLNILNGGDSDE